MPIHRQELEEFEFKHTHNIAMNGDMPDFVEVAASPLAACVYMWVSPGEEQDQFEVLYVGKAGYGVPRRLQQHRGGFVNSGTGRQNRALLTQWLGEGRAVRVMTRRSAMQRVFGALVSLYSTEEEALCARFMPRWNRAAFPRAAEAELPAVVPAGVPAANGALPAPADVVAAGPIFDFAGGDEVAAFFGALPAPQQAQFAQLVTLIEQRNPAAGRKVVRRYAHQPAGCNGIPTLTFGRISNGGRAMSFSGRIPLVAGPGQELTVTFPETARNPDLDTALIASGPSGVWRPLDLVHFLMHPGQYLR